MRIFHSYFENFALDVGYDRLEIWGLGHLPAAHLVVQVVVGLDTNNININVGLNESVNIILIISINIMH